MDIIDNSVANCFLNNFIYFHLGILENIQGKIKVILLQKDNPSLEYIKDYLLNSEYKNNIIEMIKNKTLILKKSRMKFNDAKSNYELLCLENDILLIPQKDEEFFLHAPSDVLFDASNDFAELLR